MALSMRTAIWSPGRRPLFQEDAEPMGMARKFSQVKWATTIV